MEEDSGSLDVILDYLQKKGFSRAEAALRSELSSRPDINGFLKLSLIDKDEPAGIKDVVEEGKKVEKPLVMRNQQPSSDSNHVGGASPELIVKEIECRTANTNGSDSSWRLTAANNEHNVSSEVFRNNKKDIPQGFEETMLLDLYPCKVDQNNGAVDLSPCSSGYVKPDLAGVQKPGTLHLYSAGVADKAIDAKPFQEISITEHQRVSWVGSSSKADQSQYSERNDVIEVKDVNQERIVSEEAVGDVRLRNTAESKSLRDQMSECSNRTVFPFSGKDVQAYDCSIGRRMDGKKMEATDVRAAVKEQVDEVGRSLYLTNLQGLCDQSNVSHLGLSAIPENHQEELPRLPPVRLKSEFKEASANWEERLDSDDHNLKLNTADNDYLIGSFLDIPVGQDISTSGGKRIPGGNWLSVSQGLTEDTSDLVSGFATIGDGITESIDYQHDYWDSDEYDDDDDVGYMRQPIEDEAWFLAHEIDYPSDNEKGTGHRSGPDLQETTSGKVDDDNESLPEEDSYFTGEQYLQSNNMEAALASDDPIRMSITEVQGTVDDNDLINRYDGRLMDEEELSLMCSEPVWKGLESENLIMLVDKKGGNECGRHMLDDIHVDDDYHGSVRSIGVGINSDAADIGSEVRESLIGGSSEDLEYFHNHDAASRRSIITQSDINQKCNDISVNPKKKFSKHLSGNAKGENSHVKNQTDGGFSFPGPLRSGERVQVRSSNSLWSTNNNHDVGDDTNSGVDTMMANEEMMSSWMHERSSSSPAKSSRDENDAAIVRSTESTPSPLSYDGYVQRNRAKKEEDDNAASLREEDPGASLDDEEAAAVQDQVRQIKAQEEEFETFNLKVVHRKNRTGFEEDKNFHVVLNSVIAGRYHVTEYLGSAAFSKAIQAHDLHTGMDVCIKVIKNNKDFFDQSLDEIKLLKYVNTHDPADRYHLLRLYDYFYYREHLLIVCELLKANLYEFHKFNRESGGEVYFTMPRLQSITIQILEALKFLHGLGLIHCDLKPENILVKSYSRCEVKVIDLGSSCFETDHLCSYVQSRSYRAPEVILGLPYDNKIDVWSLGCILAELCTGNVIFQNDSPATLLARVIGIIGPIQQEMLAKGRDTCKYFTKNHMLYERNQESNRLEYLIPKKSSLRHRLPMGDQGFIDFISYLLEINPRKRPSASEALNHPWLSYPYEPISS
ncbi:hypothetical protein V2J09_011305 [Rumex salicifolius]